MPRAELQGIINAKRACKRSEAANVCIWSDSQYVVRGNNEANWDRLLKGANGDLWLLAQEEHSENCEIQKLKAHAEAKVLNGAMCPRLFLLNALADAGADAYTESAVEGVQILDYEKWQAIAYSVSLRLAILEAEARAARPKQVEMDMTAPKLPSIPTELDVAAELRRAISKQGHKLQPEGQFIACTKCR